VEGIRDSFPEPDGKYVGFRPVADADAGEE
jgi:hypothetical protein